MRPTLFVTILLALLGFAVPAGAACYAPNPNATSAADRLIEVDPVAVADASGVIETTTPTGDPIRVSGFAPYARLCRSLLFDRATAKCGGTAFLESKRDPRFCKGVAKGHTCVHIACKKKHKQT